MNKYILLLTVSALFAFSSCRPNTDCENPKQAVLEDFYELHMEDCGWLFVLENDNKLNPINLSDFSIDLTDGKKYWISYESTSGIGCSSSSNIIITCIEERK